MIDQELRADIEIDCPRCAKPATVRFYGPCQACAEELKGKYLTTARDVEAPEYEPKMNVTPNAVATKE